MHIQQAAQPPLNIQQGQLLITNRLIADNTRPGKGALATAPLGPRVAPKLERGAAGKGQGHQTGCVPVG